MQGGLGYCFGEEDGSLEFFEFAEALACGHGVGGAGEFAVGVGNDGVVDLAGLFPVCLSFGEQAKSELSLADGAVVLGIKGDDLLVECLGTVADVGELLGVQVGGGEVELGPERLGLCEQGGGGEAGVGGLGGELGEGVGQSLSVIGLNVGKVGLLAGLAQLGLIGGVVLFDVASGQEIAQEDNSLSLSVEPGVVPPEACDDEDDEDGEAYEQVVAVFFEVFGEVAEGLGQFVGFEFVAFLCFHGTY